MAVTRGTPTTPGIANSPVVPLPASVTTDGVLLMRVSNTNNGSATVTTPAGWTYIDNQHDAANASQYLFWKPAFAADSGGTVTLAVSDTSKAYRYSVVQLLGADRTNPFPQVLGGAMAGASTGLTTGALTIHSTNPSGTKYLLAMMQAGGFFTYSAETANGFTSPTVDEFVDTQGSLAVLISAPTSTATSTFSVTMSASNRAAWTIMSVAEASTGVTGTAASVLPAFTQSATGTRTVPAFTGTAASSLPALTQSATGTRTVPAFTGTAASTLPALTQSAAGTHVPPVFTGIGASVLAAVTQTATGTSTAPGAGGIAASVLPSLTQSATGTFTAPVFTGTAESVLPALTQTAAGAVTAPVFTGVATSVLAALTQAATGTRTVPVFSGTAASVLAAVVQAAEGTFTPPPSGRRARLSAADVAHGSLQTATGRHPSLTSTSQPASLTTA